MKRRYLLARLLCLLATASPAFASSTTSGYSRDITSHKNGWVYFNHDGTRIGLASCQATGSPKAWALDVSTAAGQAQYATLLTAYSLNKPVLVNGTGLCDPYAQDEQVSHLWFVDP